MCRDQSEFFSTVSCGCSTFRYLFWLSCEDSLLFHLLASVIGCEYRESDLTDTVIVIHKKWFVELIFFTDHVEISMDWFLLPQDIWRKNINTA